MRDSQRSRLYAAEDAAFMNLFSGDDHEATACWLQAFVNHVMGRSVVLELLGQPESSKLPGVAVEFRDGVSGAIAVNGHTIVFGPREHLRRGWVALHELAHIIHHRLYGGHQFPSHGWRFAAIYLRLVRDVLGADRAKELAASFRKHRVRHKEPRSRTQTEGSRAGLAKARAALIARNAARFVLRRSRRARLTSVDGTRVFAVSAIGRRHGDQHFVWTFEIDDQVRGRWMSWSPMDYDTLPGLPVIDVYQAWLDWCTAVRHSTSG